MPVRLYALLTWTTLRRLPLIHSGAAAFLRRMLPEIARPARNPGDRTRHRAKPPALGVGTPAPRRRPSTRSGIEGRQCPHCQPRRRDAARSLAVGGRIRSAIAERSGSCAGIRYVRTQATRHPELAVDESPGESTGWAECAPSKKGAPPGRARPLRARTARRESLVVALQGAQWRGA